MFQKEMHSLILPFDAAISYLSLILVCLQEFPVDLNVYLSMPWKDLPSSKKMF